MTEIGEQDAVQAEAAPLIHDTMAGECACCGTRAQIFTDSHLCEDCDVEHHYCCICKTYEHEDDPCRHLYQNEHCEWIGSGTGGADEFVQKSFMAMLGLMPRGFAAELRAAIDRGEFHTWFVAPLIGGGGKLHLRGLPWGQACEWGRMLVDIGSGDHAGGTSDGFNWLVSLYDGDTRDANRLTVSWIDQHLVASEVAA